MKKICQLYVPQIARTFGSHTLEVIRHALGFLDSHCNFTGIYLIAMWESGGADNGFDVIDYRVDPKYGTDDDFLNLIKVAHSIGFEVGVDVVPNHVSERHALAQGCLRGLPGYDDVLYIVSGEEAARLSAAGVPSLFGKEAYSEVEGFKGQDKFVRNTFCDGRQLNLNWNSPAVKNYFSGVFKRLSGVGVDFIRVDCSILLHEDVTKASPENPLACINAEKSVKAIREVAGDIPLYHEWFGGPFSPDILNGDPLSLALDCSYVLCGQQPTEWTHPKLVPLVGGHDQMPFWNRAVQQGFDPIDVLNAAEAAPCGIVFEDLLTWFGYKIPEDQMAPTAEDLEFDANIENPNMRYLGRRKLPDFVSNTCAFGL